ncbi:MAG: ATP-dependent RNA helicase HrpA [Brachymonas sp.]
MPPITFPPDLPVSARRAEIEAAFTAHQVLIVCGETGSGKTTQLPKIALNLGRAAQPQQAGGRRKLIGHTQPRRIAASSVASRIAEELQTPLGELVGYKVRFHDRISPSTAIKLMTDGILLAETQTDPLLKAYDTLIIDEAHERSLNIDFLLGYLRQILPKRPDLKVIVTSATIDAERFAQHFKDAKSGQPAPVLMVSGRMFPVEQRYRPFQDSRDYGLNEAIADAVDELWAGGKSGDILVFLPGEREIRDAAEHLRGHLSHSPVLRSAEVLPLYARLAQGEQDRIFHPKGQRRIVLATNVAETSLTVPGIRYVVDAGTARVKRYSYRQKVEQLLIEPISQAAANQRAGRCGRVADGICIRLYDEADFAKRPAFTDPEILRSSLAAVILRMQSLHLGAVEDFPFLQAPSGRAIADGWDLLAELGAVDEAKTLTKSGRELAKLPLDPRIGRMILEAKNRHALQEVLVIAAALSVPDVRERPREAQQQAAQAHAVFDDEKSEFVSWLKLWDWLEKSRGGAPSESQKGMDSRFRGNDDSSSGNTASQSPSQAPTPALPQRGREQGSATHKLSNRQWEALLRKNFISIRRVREWRDVYSQLRTVVAEQRWRMNEQPASYEQLHISLLAGLLGNIGFKLENEDGYLGARGIKFHPNPGHRLKKKLGRWIVAAELVETSRLFARGLANIEPQWLEQIAAHVLKKQVLDARWEQKQACAVASERATLYGLVVYSGRRVQYERLDPAGARAIMIRDGLLPAAFGADWLGRLPFVAANQKTLAQVEALEHKSRRQDVLVDDALIVDFYDSQIPTDISNATALAAWYKDAVRDTPQLLRLSREELMRHEAAGITTEAFPKLIRLGGVDCPAHYLHEPGHARDGLSVDVPLFALNQVAEERGDWLVPGMLKDKLLALLKSLPQKPRARLVPLPQTATDFAAQLSEAAVFASGSLMDALRRAVREKTGLEVKSTDFKQEVLQAHHLMHLRVLGDDGRQLGAGRSLAALKAELGSQARGAFQALAALKQAIPSTKITGKSPENAVNTAQAAPENEAIKTLPEGQTQIWEDDARYSAWTFGELPELLEIRRGKGRQQQTLIGFPALIDAGDAVTIEVFDEPEVAAAQHQAGLRRLVALQLKDALKYLEKNIPDLQKMAVAYMPLGTQEELRAQIIEVALNRAFLAEPLPTDASSFKLRVEEGRGRLTLIANEVARLAGTVLAEYAAASRKAKDARAFAEAQKDTQEQIARLLPKNFVTTTPWLSLQHLPRYLKAITIRLDKIRADSARDAQKLAELRPQEQRYLRLLAERKGQHDARLEEVRWLLQELRVSFFAQELRTPQPVSIKRLEKVWQALQH